MRSRKYESFNSALSDLQSKGTLKYWGRIGQYQEINLYTYKHQGMEYTLYIYQDGLVELRNEPRG